MGSVGFKNPAQYEDPEYQATHQGLFSGGLLCPLETVLPPDVSQADFDSAIAEFQTAVGKENTFLGEALVEYVDPYELWEHEGKRKMPSAAVW